MMSTYDDDLDTLLDDEPFAFSTESNDSDYTCGNCYLSTEEDKFGGGSSLPETSMGDSNLEGGADFLANTAANTSLLSTEAPSLLSVDPTNHSDFTMDSTRDSYTIDIDPSSTTSLSTLRSLYE